MPHDDDLLLSLHGLLGQVARFIVEKAVGVARPSDSLHEDDMAIEAARFKPIVAGRQRLLDREWLHDLHRARVGQHLGGVDGHEVGLLVVELHVVVDVGLVGVFVQVLVRAVVVVPRLIWVI